MLGASLILPSFGGSDCFYFTIKLNLEAGYLHLYLILATFWLTLTIYLTFLGFDFLMCKMEIIIHLAFLVGLNELLHVVLRVEPGT